MKTSAWGFLAVCMLAAQAGADPHDPAAAQALYDDAVALMKTKAYAKACPKLAESQRLDPGIGTQFRLAECYEGQGLTASAWAQFLEVASLASASGQVERQQAARKRATRLEPRLGRIRVAVAAPKRVTGLRVERDGVLVQEVSWDSPLPTDPGEHEVTASAPGYKSFAAKIIVQEGQTAVIEIPQLEAVPAAPLEAPNTSPAVVSPPPPAPPRALEKSMAADAAQPEKPSSGGLGPVVIGLGAIGVVGVGVGTVLGFMARSKFEDSKAQCNAANEDRCSGAGVKLRDDSIALANGATVGFIAGGVALAGAGIVLLARPSSKQATAARVGASFDAAPGAGKLVVSGSF